MSAENKDIRLKPNYWFTVLELGGNAVGLLQNAGKLTALETRLGEVTTENLISKPHVFFDSDRDEPTVCIGMHLEAADASLANAEAMAITFEGLSRAYLLSQISLQRGRLMPSAEFFETGLANEDSWTVMEHTDEPDFARTYQALIDEYNTFGTFVELPTAAP